MNKIFLVLAVFAVVASVATGNGTYKKMKENFDECKTSSNYKGESLNLDTESSQEFKCFLNCIGEKMTTMKDGKLQGDTVLAMVEKKYGKGEILDKSNVGVPKCIGEVKETEKCEAAYQYGKCVMREVPEIMKMFGGGKKE